MTATGVARPSVADASAALDFFWQAVTSILIFNLACSCQSDVACTALAPGHRASPPAPKCPFGQPAVAQGTYSGAYIRLCARDCATEGSLASHSFQRTRVSTRVTTARDTVHNGSVSWTLPCIGGAAWSLCSSGWGSHVTQRQRAVTPLLWRRCDAGHQSRSRGGASDGRAVNAATFTGKHRCGRGGIQLRAVSSGTTVCCRALVGHRRRDAAVHRRAHPGRLVSRRQVAFHSRR